MIFKTFRPVNLIAIVLLQVLCFVVGGEGSIASLVGFIILPTVLSAGAGYLINDFYDQKSDAFNKKQRISFGQFKSWIWLYAGLNILALILAFFDGTQLGLLVLSIQFTLWLYSYILSRVALLGNLVVSATSLFTILIFYFSIHVSLHIQQIWILLISIFLITMARELIKDIEDVEGDYSIKAQTLPIMTSNQLTHVISDLFLVCNSIFIASWTFYDYFGVNNAATIFGIILSVSGISIVFYGHLNNSVLRYRHLSIALKIYMFVGMFLVCFLNYV